MDSRSEGVIGAEAHEAPVRPPASPGEAGVDCNVVRLAPRQRATDAREPQPLAVGLSADLLAPEHARRGLDGVGVYTSVLLRTLSSCGCKAQGWSFPHWFGRRSAAVGRALPVSQEVALLRGLLSQNWRMSVDADVFHVTDYRIVRMDCPVVATLHDAAPVLHPEWYGGRAQLLKNFIVQRTARHVDHVIALSHSMVRELVQYYGVKEERISVVPCGVASAWLQPPPSQQVRRTLAQHGLRPGYFLFVGTLQPRKNVERVLQAYLCLPPQIRRAHPLVLAGRAGWRSEPVLARIRDARERGEQVVWLDYISGEDTLRHLYAGALAFVFPSLHEGFGIPVAEAFACGVPVVTSNSTSLPEVSKGAALEVSPLSIDEIAAAMRDLARDESLRQRCIAAGRKRATQLTWERTVEMTAEVYRSMLRR